ncbi:MAG: hypothetical protein ACLFOY_19225, partial [Desulfatibacillaceae bacterium]
LHLIVFEQAANSEFFNGLITAERAPSVNPVDLFPAPFQSLEHNLHHRIFGRHAGVPRGTGASVIPAGAMACRCQQVAADLHPSTGSISR